MAIIKFSLCVLAFLYLLNISECSAESGVLRDAKDVVGKARGVAKGVIEDVGKLFVTVVTLPAWKIIFAQKIFKKIVKVIEKMIKAVIEMIIKINTFKINTIAKFVKWAHLDIPLKYFYDSVTSLYKAKKKFIKKILHSLSNITGPYEKALLPITDKLSSRVLITLNWLEAFITGDISHCAGNTNLEVGATKALMQTKADKIKATIDRIILLLGFSDVVKKIKGEDVQSVEMAFGTYKRSVRAASSTFFKNRQDKVAFFKRDLDDTFIANDKIVNLGKLDANLKPRRVAP
ncbi:uncharacterized protein LOC143189902 isoform X1 [Rhynchophorus ferrugineus]|uniref:uncharacterized protein LOC143189902 isoform X1 n=1 Tax=Rhynchophorus ferrugineus TaxID=354439 RepID=UPI003FCCA42C